MTENFHVLGHFVSISERLCSISIGLVKVTAFLIENKVFFNNLCTITYIFKFYCSNVTGLHVQDTHGGAFAALLSCPLLPRHYFIPWWPTYITRKGTNHSKDFQFPERSPQNRYKHCLKSLMPIKSSSRWWDLAML